MAGPFLPQGEPATGCPVCGSDRCSGMPDELYPTNPFLPDRGLDRMAQEPYVIADRSVTDDAGRQIIAPGDRVSVDDARRYGLIDAAPARAKHGPAADRMKRPMEDR